MFRRRRGSGAAHAQTVLKFSHTDQPGGARQRPPEMFAQKVEQYTSGRYKVQVYSRRAARERSEGGRAAPARRHRLHRHRHRTYATHIPTLNLMLMPYLVDTTTRAGSSTTIEVAAEAVRRGPKKGFRILATWEAGFRSMTTKDPLNSPADAKGKKLRTYPNEMQRWLLEAMGFTVQIMPVTEVYLAIQQGTVAGQENPIDTIHANKFYEVAPNVTLTQHVYSPIPLAISEKTWQSLSPPTARR